jgi:signal transduction histidine kinase
MTPGNELSFLVVATDDDGRASLRKSIARAGLGKVEAEGDADRALGRAASDGFDAVIVDRLRGRTAVDLATAMRGRGVTAAILLVVTDDDAELERAALEAGVTDVLTAADLAAPRLAHRLRSAVRSGRADADAAQMLERAQGAAAARDELLSIVSHDLRSPLNAIVLACDALDADITENERKRYVAAVRRAGQRAERLLRDLLDVSRIESGGLKLEQRALSVKSLLEQIRGDHELQARDANSTVTLEIPDDAGQVFADRDRVLQVLANLVGNALKHAPGSPVTIGATSVPEGVELWVADKGPGITPDALPHVFDRFWQGRTRRRGGAGLGLTIARGIVAAHSGQIRADSEVGQGTRFTVRLPRPGASGASAR